MIIGKLIPAATGLKRYRTIEIEPAVKVGAAAYARPESEAELLAALEEIGSAETDGGGLDLEALGLESFGGAPGADEPISHEAGEAEETPEVDSPLDD